MAVLLLGCLLLAACSKDGGSDQAWQALPVIPPLDSAVGTKIRDIAAQGREAGRDARVFIKVGDSITESPTFLQEMACAEPNWGHWRRLRGIWGYFRLSNFPPDYTVVWCGVADSYSRASLAAKGGWTAAESLQPRPEEPSECAGRPALTCEISLLNPSVALVMFGTNDLGDMSAQAFRSDLARVARTLSDAGVIPVLSTIPPRTDRPELEARVPEFNDEIAALAKNRDLPLWNYWRQMIRAPEEGLGPDGIHPSLPCPPCNPSDFSGAGLQGGYALRNLGALRVLDRIRRMALAG